jgi:hypothetical protein
MIYCIDSDSVTLAAAHTTKGAIGTIKFLNGFWNPPTSQTTAVIYQARIAQVSGTPAGPLYWNFLCETNLLTNTITGTIRSAVLSIGAGASQMVPEVNVVLTQTSGTPSFLQLGVVGGPAAIASGAGVNSFVAYYPTINGSNYIVVPPGTIIGITGTGAAGVFQSTIYWEEFPA